MPNSSQLKETAYMCSLWDKVKKLKESEDPLVRSRGCVNLRLCLHILDLQVDTFLRGKNI